MSICIYIYICVYIYINYRSLYTHLVSLWLHVNHVIVSREFSPRFCPRKWRLKHFYWHRIIADEFHELIGAAVDGHHPFNEAKHQLTQLEAESRWGLNLGSYISTITLELRACYVSRCVLWWRNARTCNVQDLSNHLSVPPDLFTCLPLLLGSLCVKD